MSSIKTSTVVYISLGTVLSGCLAYAAYFDYKRRHDVEFRKSLKREARKQARAAKEEAEGAKTKERQELRTLVDEANEEGFPEGADDKEAFFMEEVGMGERLCQSGLFGPFLFFSDSLLRFFGLGEEGRCVERNRRADGSTGSTNKEAALCFFKALRVYPQPKELMNIYDKTVPKVLFFHPSIPPSLHPSVPPLPSPPHPNHHHLTQTPPSQNTNHTTNPLTQPHLPARPRPPSRNGRLRPRHRQRQRQRRRRQLRELFRRRRVE